MFFFTLQDRKRQFEIQKLQRENQKQHSVLQRKSEEVYIEFFLSFKRASRKIVTEKLPSMHRVNKFILA